MYALTYLPDKTQLGELRAARDRLYDESMQSRAAIERDYEARLHKDITAISERSKADIEAIRAQARVSARLQWISTIA